MTSRINIRLNALTTGAFVACAAAAIALSGCNKPRRVVLTQEQEKQIQSSLLKEEPTPQIVANALMDGKVRLLGVDLSAKEVKAGNAVDITWYWKVEQPVGEGGWKLFVHFESPGQRRTTHDHQAVGELYPVPKWKVGDIVKDVQRIQIPADFPNGPAKLFVGIFDEAAWVERQANVRMAVSNTGEVKVPVDAEGRIEAATLKIIGGKVMPKAGSASAQKRAYEAFRAPEPLIMDGKLDELAWRRATVTRPFVKPGGGPMKPAQMARARMLWDDTNLYIGMTAVDDDLFNDQTGRDATLWKQDVLEVYLDPGKDGKDYVELQFSPTAEVFDALFTSRRKPEWPKAAAALTMSGMVAKVHAEGSVNDRAGAADKRWSVEVAIPWADVPGVSGPPSDGTVWGLNFYRIDVTSPTRPGFMSAWSPAGGDFHNVDGFGAVTFKAKVRPSAPTRRVRTMPERPATRRGAPEAVKAAVEGAVVKPEAAKEAAKKVLPKPAEKAGAAQK